MESNIIKHPYSYELPEGQYSFDYRVLPNFWSKTNKLNKVSDILDNFNCDDEENDPMPLIQIVNGMYHDFYNNGTGNECFWNNRILFKKLIRKQGFSSKIIKSLEQRYSNVFHHIKRGSAFGWVRDGEDRNLGLTLEQLTTDIVFYIGYKYLPNEAVFKVLLIENKVKSF
jgi:hypothetical protein